MKEKSSYTPLTSSEVETEACLPHDGISLHSIINTQKARLKAAKAVIAVLTFLYFASALGVYIFSTKLHEFATYARDFRVDPIHGKISLVPVVFQNNDTFVEDNPMSHNSVWKEILAAKSAIVPVPNAEALGLSGGMPPSNGSEHQGFGTSMFHQLHCLSKIKVELMYIWEHVGEADLTDHVIKTQSHMKHCVEYIRQGIMCAGDLTPEKAMVDGDYYYGPTPWGAEHTCVDFQAVRTGVMENLFKGYLYLPVNEAKRAAFLEDKRQGKTSPFLPSE